MEIKERVYEFVKAKGLTVKNFEERCGLSNGYVSSMRKGFGMVKLENVLKEFPDLSRDWLLYGEGDMLREVPSAQGAQGDGGEAVERGGHDAEYIAHLEDEIEYLRKKMDELWQLVRALTKQP